MNGIQEEYEGYARLVEEMVVLAIHTAKTGQRKDRLKVRNWAARPYNVFLAFFAEQFGYDEKVIASRLMALTDDLEKRTYPCLTCGLTDSKGTVRLSYPQPIHDPQEVQSIPAVYHGIPVCFPCGIHLCRDD